MAIRIKFPYFGIKEDIMLYFNETEIEHFKLALNTQLFDIIWVNILHLFPNLLPILKKFKTRSTDKNNEISYNDSQIFNINIRPYLKELLLYCFDTFASVGIWTAASRTWFEYVFKTTLYPILQQISTELKKDCVFTHILTYDDCQFIYNENNIYCLSKPLNKLWNLWYGMTPDNTLIVDNLKESFISNPQNGILIPSFINNNDDRYLLYLIELLKRILNEFPHVLTVLNINKT